MDFKEYQEAVTSTALYPEVGTGSIGAITYCTLGLAGEAGEIAEKVKKLIRDSGGIPTPEFRAAILKEIGDPLWYIAALSKELGFTLEEVAQANKEKLFGRRERGTLQGSGDDR